MLLCSNFVKCCRREIGEIVRYLTDKKNKISPASQAIATARITPKICQGQLQQYAHSASDFIPNWFTFGGVIAKLVNAVFAQ